MYLIVNHDTMKNIEKIKSYKGKINTTFYSDKVQKEGSQCICLSVILIGSVFIRVEKYYPYVFLKECEYIFKEKDVPKYITNDF